MLNSLGHLKLCENFVSLKKNKKVTISNIKFTKILIGTKLDQQITDHNAY